MCGHGLGPSLLPCRHHCMCTQYLSASARCSSVSHQFALCKKLFVIAQSGGQLCYLILSGVSLATLLSPPDNFTKACRSLSSSKSSKLLSCLPSASIKVIYLGALLRSGDRTSCNTCIVLCANGQSCWKLQLYIQLCTERLFIVGMHWSSNAFLKLHQKQAGRPWYQCCCLFFDKHTSSTLSGWLTLSSGRWFMMAGMTSAGRRDLKKSSIGATLSSAVKPEHIECTHRIYVETPNQDCRCYLSD